MKQITPYKTLQGALNALDNGGRFYNIFTKAKDEVITGSELYKAAGVISGKAQALLFFELSVSDLPETDRNKVIQRLSPELRSTYLQERPKCLQVEAFEKAAQETDAVIVTGFPAFLEDKTQFSGFIFIPISTGKTTSFMMIPIFDKFDIYEVYTDSDLKGDKTIIATVRGSKKLSPDRTTFAGVIKKLEFKNKSKKPHSLYVETLYYKTE